MKSIAARFADSDKDMEDKKEHLKLFDEPPR